MKDHKKILACILAVSALFSTAVSCSSKKDSSSDSSSSEEEWKGSDDVSVDLDAVEDTSAAQPKGKGTDPNMTINWLSYYDINPSGNNDRPVALALFEDYYGGQVNYIYTDSGNKFNALSEMLLAGDKVDMFPFEWENIPSGVMKEQFDPLDPYFDTMEIDSDLWSDMSDAIDMFKYNGQHYVIPYSVSDPLIVTYSRKIMQSEGLGDPYTLYKEGKWDWNTFMDMMEKFVANTPEGYTRYGINGWFGQALMMSTSHTVVNYDGQKFINNINDPEIEKAELLMQDIAKKNLYRNEWVGYFPDDHSTLFFAMADWALGESNAKNEDMDLMIVPFPKAPDAKNYYLSCNYGAKMLVKGSEHGEAVANYIKCERLAAVEDTYIEAAKAKALIEDRTAGGVLKSKITEEQYDALQTYKDPSVISPIFDFGYGMGDAMYGDGQYTYETRGVMNNLTSTLLEGSTSVDSWAKMRDSLTGIIDKEIQKFN